MQYDLHCECSEGTNDEIQSKISTGIIKQISTLANEEESQDFQREIRNLIGSKEHIHQQVSIDCMKLLFRAFQIPRGDKAKRASVDIIDILFCFFSYRNNILKDEYKHLQQDIITYLGNQMQKTSIRRAWLASHQDQQITKATMYALQQAIIHYDKAKQKRAYTKDLLISCLATCKNLYGFELAKTEALREVIHIKNNPISS